MKNAALRKDHKWFEGAQYNDEDENKYKSLECINGKEFFFEWDNNHE